MPWPFFFNGFSVDRNWIFVIVFLICSNTVSNANVLEAYVQINMYVYKCINTHEYTNIQVDQIYWLECKRI